MMITPNPNPRPTYYIHSGRKAQDFTLGLIVIPFISLLVGNIIPMSLVGYKFSDLAIAPLLEFVGTVLWISVLPAYIGLSIYFVVRRRYFISIGMITTIVLTLSFLIALGRSLENS